MAKPKVNKINKLILKIKNIVKKKRMGLLLL